MVDMMPPRWNWRNGLPPVVVVDNVWLHERWYLNKCLGGVGGGENLRPHFKRRFGGPIPRYFFLPKTAPG